MKKKLNAGCGTDILPEWINLDKSPLAGVDVVHDLSKFPWPFEDDQFDEIMMINVLEHLPDTVRVLEELYRTSRNGCVIHLRVPYWNSYISYGDPTHLKTFHQNTFDFFDPTTDLGKKVPYYSNAKYKILKKYYWVYFKFSRWERYLKISNHFFKNMLEILASHFCNIIYLFEIDLKTLK